MSAVLIFQGVAIGAFAVLCCAFCAAGLHLVRRQSALKARVHALETANERLHDDLWELRESEERYRGLVEGQNDLIVRRDTTGRLSYVNDAFVALAGRPREDLLGTRFALSPAGVQPWPSGSHESRAYDQELPGGAGSPSAARWISWVETPVRSPDGASTEIQAVGRDVTARRRSEIALAEVSRRAEAASEAKSRFLASVSHELRTPLNGVLGMADLLDGTGLTPEQASYVGAVRTSGEALLSLINEILDFSKIEAGRLDLVDEPFDLVALVEGTAELLAPRAQDKGIGIAASIDAAVARFVLGDAVRLRQVLTNLAGNAVKFTESGGVGISVAPDGDRLAFVVADTGIGIPADRLAAIFEEFEQADASASRRYEGTGLGLAISRRLVAGMGGELTVESTPGQGSVFRFSVPLPAVPDAPLRPAFPDGLAGRSVHIVTSRPFEGDYIARRLEAGGMVPVLSADPSGLDAAFTQGAQGRPDLLVLDGAVGEATARDIAARARAAGVPRLVVLLSPFERRAFGSPAAAGFDAYLTKPVRERSMLAQLVAAPSPPVAAAPAASPPGSQKPLRILLAEDNDINALLATKLLERSGARVRRAADGLEAVDLFRAACEPGNEPFDLVLMDVRMPGLDGHEAARRIRVIEADHAAARVRIVALTANVSEEDRRRVLAAGMDAVLAKPLEPGRLFEVLGQEPAARSART